jgi:L-ribulose-5-phosphate 4-epimerase
MSFTPTPERLVPDLEPRQELVLLARTLWEEGYRDHLAGHITCNLGDGTLLCNPWLLAWDELTPSQVIRIDLEGSVVEGDWPAPLGIPLHLALHQQRPGVAWAMHNHPLFGTLWSDLGEVPPPMDQSSSATGENIELVQEYEGAVSDMGAAERAIKAMGDADIGLLRGHGVLVLGGSCRAVYHRAVALEIRSEHAWYLRCAGSSMESPVPAWWLERNTKSNGEGPRGYWEPSVRRALRAAPDLLKH